ncbi:glycosyltransferase family 2 protein [Faecalimonas hominis]
MTKLTIHTATYNRAYILDKAYESLKMQTNKNFEWIITDDGSTDGTEKLVKSWMNNENGFSIIYNKLEHVGIPRALNFGVNESSTEWFMMLDSDDYILPNTVELVLKWLEEIKDEPKIAGIGFARCFPNGEYMKNQIPQIDKAIGFVDASHIERKKYNLDMDMCEVHRTELFRKYPFEVWPDEKYAPEQLNFFKMALCGWKMRWRAEKLYICEYLPDGQTKDDCLVKNNPMGFAMMHNQNMLIHKTIKEKSHDAIQMIALTCYAKNYQYLKQSNSKLLTILLMPVGLILSQRRKYQYKNMI